MCHHGAPRYAAARLRARRMIVLSDAMPAHRVRAMGAHHSAPQSSALQVPELLPPDAYWISLATG